MTQVSSQFFTLYADERCGSWVQNHGGASMVEPPVRHSAKDDLVRSCDLSRAETLTLNVRVTQ
jgi:hypothetical protein